jgi:glutamate--cysteine ligase
MMRRTASLQVNLDGGEDSAAVSGYRARWALAHRIGPVIVASFANSPLKDGKPTGWLSTRQATWSLMDAGRTAHPPYAPDPRDAWTRYALDARVLCVRDTAAERDGAPGDWTAPPGLTFRQWVRGAAGLRRPTAADLDYHLSTLFPPVRPRGYVEVRYLDTQPTATWQHPLLLVSALFSSQAVTERALELTERSAGDWLIAARRGLADTTLRATARDLVELAADHLDPSLDQALGAQVMGALHRRTSDAARRQPA